MEFTFNDPWCMFDEYKDNQEDATMNSPIINPINNLHSHRTGGIYNITAKEIEAVLGFPPNIQDDPDKVTVSWGFEMNGNLCAIWDYKGSLRVSQVSCFGSDHVFQELFGSKYAKD